MKLDGITELKDLNVITLDDILEFMGSKSDLEKDEFKRFASTPNDEGQLPGFFSIRTYIGRKYFSDLYKEKEPTMLEKILSL